MSVRLSVAIQQHVDGVSIDGKPPRLVSALAGSDTFLRGEYRYILSRFGDPVGRHTHNVAIGDFERDVRGLFTRRNVGMHS